MTASIGILEQAAPMIQDFFRTGSGDSTVTAAEAAGFVGMLSLANRRASCGRACPTSSAGA